MICLDDRSNGTYNNFRMVFGCKWKSAFHMICKQRTIRKIPFVALICKEL